MVSHPRGGAAFLVVLAAGLIAIALAPAAGAAAGLADSAWPMFQHDPQHSGRSPASSPSTLELKWRFQVEGQPGSPAIGPDGVIYVPTGRATLGAEDRNGFLYAINPDGTLRWRYEFPSPLGVCETIPAVTTPAVAADGTVYVHTEAGLPLAGPGYCVSGPSYLFAINPDGTQKWFYAFNLGGAVLTAGNVSSPVVGADGTIYATSADTGLHAIDPADGAFNWIVSPDATSIGSSPALGADGTIYVSIFDLHAYDPNGNPLWTADLGNGCCIDASPSVGADGTIYACGINPDGCHAVSPNGTIQWSLPLRAQRLTTPALGADGTVYLATEAGSGATALTALNPDGSQRWRNLYALGSARVGHSPAIGAGARIYARGDLGVGPGGFFGTLFVVDHDGIESDKESLPATNEGTGELNAAIGADGTVYVPQPHVEAGLAYNPNDQHLAAYTQGSAPPDETSPVLAIKGSKRQRLDSAIEVRASCDEPCDLNGTGTLNVNLPTRSRIARHEVRRVRFPLKRASAQLAGAQTTTLRLRLPKRARSTGAAAFAGGGSAFARISVTAVDAAGNQAKKSKRIRLRASPRQ